MSDAYEVRKYGTDSSGRDIFMNRRMKAAFDVACQKARVTPVIVQGAYMRRTGGGAGASAGTHDAGACLDTRTWDLSWWKQRRLIRAGRSVGWAVWKRSERHGGFDEHMHWVLLGDKDATDDAQWQMREYREGRDGLASGGRDYHWRPRPIPVFDYAEWLK
ncbi:MAG: hypothetical protein ACRDKW_06155, partial [Actinomycetota bacterium]